MNVQAKAVPPPAPTLCRLAAITLVATITALTVSAANATAGEKQTLEHSIVKIYVTIQQDDFSMPWQSYSPQSGNGSGFIIKGNRILSNAHVVSNAKFIEVRKNGSPRRFPAHVKFAAHDCDLAVLEVDDPDFFNDTHPVEFATGIPNLSDKVTVIGYPMGGSRISLTEGVVSRIDYARYAHSGVDQHLVLQVDAAINPGNSGGPVMMNGKVVGVAFQGMRQASNIGYVIPIPIIKHFLADIKDGKYHGYPVLGVSIMDTRNAALRKSLGMTPEQTGPVVDFIDPFGSARNLLKPGDVLISIDGSNIANDGSISLKGNLIEFSELIERKQWGDTVNLQILRDNKVQHVNIPLTNPNDPYVFRIIYDQHPQYCMLGGLVFSPLTRNYLRTIRRNLQIPNVLQLLYVTRYAKIDGLYKNRNQFVVLIRRLPNPVNSYAGKFMYGLVSEVNAQPIGSLKDFIKAVKHPLNGYHIIKFAGMDDYLVLDAAQAEKAEKSIMKRYAVPSDCTLTEVQQ